MRYLFIAVLACAPLPASAQSVARLAPVSSPLFTRAAPRPGPMNPSPPDTHWKEGAIAGGVIAGLVGAAFAEGMCGMSESSRNCTPSLLGGAVVGAVLGATVGALIGGQFPK